MADLFAERRGVLPSEVVITRKRLSQLEERERELDAYTTAMKKLTVHHEAMRLRQIAAAHFGTDPQAIQQGHSHDEYAEGWLDASELFARTVIESRHA